MRHCGEMDVVAVGVVGLGVIGSVHAADLAAGRVAGGRLAAVSDLDVARADRYGPEVRPTASVEEMLTDDSVDAVVVATPHYSHVPIAVAALETGRHVLVEKPLAPHKAACERILAAHNDPRQILAVMLNERAHPVYRRLRRLVASGDLGTVRRIVWLATAWFRTDAYYRSSPWRATWRGEGGGVLLNQSPHQLDLWQWMFGMPERVTAFCEFGRYHDIEVEDDVTAYLEYGNGCRGVFVTTTGEAPGTDRLEVTGDLGRAIVESGAGGIGLRRNAVDAREFAATSDELFARPATTDEFIGIEDPGGHHVTVLEDFCRAIRTGTAPIAPGRDGGHSVELANAMLESTWRGGPVDLPLDGEAYAARLAELGR